MVVWQSGAFILVVVPGGEHRMLPDVGQSFEAVYGHLVKVLSDLGGQGWDVAGCAHDGGSMVWTLRRQR